MYKVKKRTALHCLFSMIIFCVSNSEGMSPFKEAENLFNDYLRKAPHAEIATVLAILQGYKSWYQAVTPIDRKLFENLSPAAISFIDSIKKIVQLNYINELSRSKEGWHLAGGSRLSKAGDTFYKSLIQMIQRTMNNSIDLSSVNHPLQQRFF